LMWINICAAQIVAGVPELGWRASFAAGWRGGERIDKPGDVAGRHELCAKGGVIGGRARQVDTTTTAGNRPARAV